MMDFREKIKRELKVLSLENKEKKNSHVSIKEGIKKTLNIKDKIKRTPVVGSIAWYFYNLLKSPFKIRNLFEEFKYLKSEFHDMKNSFELIRDDLSFRYTEPEEYMILSLSGFIRRRDSTENFYAFFEDIFRGEDIQKRVKKYVSFIEESTSKMDTKATFLDIGCGRGEFLKVLKDSGIDVKGVEINNEYVADLKKEGFNVYCGDGIEYLKTLPDNSLLGVSAIHVIEHLEFERLKEFIEVSYKKIKSQGLMIVETPNPKCSVALANFYIDFTHIRPYPYELVCFLFELAGFRDIKLILSSPADRAFRTGNPSGDYMDYAIIGFKE